MTVFIEQSVEPFTAVMERARQQGSALWARANVRRPLRGFQAEKDTYAYLRVISSDNRDLDFLDSGSPVAESDIGKSRTYSNFLLQRVAINRSELRQFVKTFGLTYLFLFGENPIMVNVSGMLLHSVDFPWDEEWWSNYEDRLRATRVAEQGARVYLSYERTLVEGYILDAGTQRDAAQPYGVPLTFTMVATAVRFLATVGYTKFPVQRYTVDFSRPQLQGRDMSGLPEGTTYSYVNEDVSTQAMRAASLPEGANAMVGFGSFGALFRSLASGQGSVAGIPAGTSVGRALISSRSQARYGRPTIHGDISLNIDEYPQGRTGTPGLNPSPYDRVARYQQMVEAQEDGELAGDVAHSVVSGGDPGLSLTNTEGLGSGHGVGMVEGELDTGAPASPSQTRPTTRPWPGATPP